VLSGFTKQYKQDSLIDRYKTRLIVKGYKKELDIEYHEVFTPVVILEL